MPKLVIVSPHFPPTNAADHQRVRMALPHLAEAGWDVEVIAVDARDVASPRDDFLTSTLPPDLAVTRVRADAGRFSGLPGMGSLGYRATPPLRRALVAALEQTPTPTNEPTLVYFSTTQFPVHRMIPELRARYPIRVVMDLQDPWANDYYSQHPEITPPGGRLRFWISDQLARRDERRVLPRLDGITSVSPADRDMLLARHPVLARTPFLTLPFGAAERDFIEIDRQGVRQNQFSVGEGRRNWVYVGRGGHDMHHALRPFFNALREASAEDESLKTVRLHFIGTDYAAAGRCRETIMPLARETGVAACVREHPQRIAYAETLRCLRDADALIVPGSDDPRYTASKLYPYLLAGKPMLTLFHRDSPAVEVMRHCETGTLVTFAPGEDEPAIRHRVRTRWFAGRAYENQPQLDPAAFIPYTAKEMSRKLSAFFEGIRQNASFNW